MGEGPVKPTEGGRDSIQRGAHRQHGDESPPARGWTKRGQQTKGKSRAGISTKFHAVITSEGQLIGGILAGGEVNDVVAGPQLSEDIVVLFYKTKYICYRLLLKKNINSKSV
jgi:hypothetical protein